jgi:hypothetical protein
MVGKTLCLGNLPHAVAFPTKKMGQDSFGEKGDDHVTSLRSCPVSVHDLHLFCLYSLFKSN